MPHVITGVCSLIPPASEQGTLIHTEMKIRNKKAFYLQKLGLALSRIPSTTNHLLHFNLTRGHPCINQDLYKNIILVLDGSWTPPLQYYQACNTTTHEDRPLLQGRQAFTRSLETASTARYSSQTYPSAQWGRDGDKRRGRLSFSEHFSHLWQCNIFTRDAEENCNRLTHFCLLGKSLKPWGKIIFLSSPIYYPRRNRTYLMLTYYAYHIQDHKGGSRKRTFFLGRIY